MLGILVHGDNHFSVPTPPDENSASHSLTVFRAVCRPLFLYHSVTSGWPVNHPKPGDFSVSVTWMNRGKPLVQSTFPWAGALGR